MSIDPDVGNGSNETVTKAVSKRANAKLVIGKAFLRQARGLAKRDDRGGIVGTRSKPRFLMPAANKRLNRNALSDVERADALRPVYIVP